MYGMHLCITRSECSAVICGAHRLRNIREMNRHKAPCVGSLGKLIDGLITSQDPKRIKQSNGILLSVCDFFFMPCKTFSGLHDKHCDLF